MSERDRVSDVSNVSNVAYHVWQWLTDKGQKCVCFVKSRDIILAVSLSSYRNFSASCHIFLMSWTCDVSAILQKSVVILFQSHTLAASSHLFMRLSVRTSVRLSVSQSVCLFVGLSVCDYFSQSIGISARGVFFLLA